MLFLLLSTSAFSYESCGLYQVVGEMSCSKEHCILVTNKGSLSEKYGLINNMNPKDFEGTSFYLAANLSVEKILNYRQVAGQISELKLIDQALYEKINSQALQLTEQGCD